MNQEKFLPMLKRIDAIVGEHIIPLEPLLLTQQWNELMPQLDQLRSEIKSQGLWAPNLPASVGGMDLSAMQLAQIAEVSGQSPLGHYCFGCQAPDAGNAELLHMYANDFIKENFLLPLAQGDR